MNSNPNQARSSDEDTPTVTSDDGNSSSEDDATSVDDESISPARIISISTEATNEEQQPQQRAKDPFLFFSNSENLRRARVFEEPNYSTEDALQDDGVTIRKSRISYEIDAATMMMNIMAEAYND